LDPRAGRGARRPPRPWLAVTRGSAAWRSAEATHIIDPGGPNLASVDCLEFVRLGGLSELREEVGPALTRNATKTLVEVLDESGGAVQTVLCRPPVQVVLPRLR
jgi:hypothetical protein